jgi:hypothetical protein
MNDEWASIYIGNSLYISLRFNEGSKGSFVPELDVIKGGKMLFHSGF